MAENAFAPDASHLDCEEYLAGDTLWVRIRARGAEWSWVTPQEAARLGAEWVQRYGGVNAA